jgi:ribosome-binding factor A
MSKPRRRTTPSVHRYPRTARLNESLREVIAEELTRIDDERLYMVTVTAIDVDAEMNRAIVFFDSLAGEDGDDKILEALNDHRVRIQNSIGRQVRAKKTPILSFKPDEVIRSAADIERILASTETLPERPPTPEGEDVYETPRVAADEDEDEEDDDEFDDEDEFEDEDEDEDDEAGDGEA